MRLIEEETGEPVPLLDTLPSLPTHLVWIFEFYTRLDRTRPAGFGPGSIPFSEILSLADLEGICYDEDIVELLFFIPRLDNVYLQYENEESKKKSKQKGRPSK